MKKFLIGTLILLALVVGIVLLLKILETQPQEPVRPPEAPEVGPKVAEFPEPPPGAIVFDMKYRGLGGGKDEMRYNSYSGFGQVRGRDTAFTADVRKRIKDFETVHNPNFKGAESAAVETKDDKAVAFYFDLDADGKLSDDEIILPIATEATGTRVVTEFVTPDFTMNTLAGRKVPFRALLQVFFYGGSSRPTCMWSPSCVLEGTSTLNGKPTRLILFGNGFTGDFDKFPGCSYALQDLEEPSGQPISRHDLSSIINYDEQFYNLKLSGSYEEDERIQVELTEYAGAIGGLAIQLKPDTNLQTRLSYAGITGVSDEKIRVRFSVPSGQTKLPVGVYKLCHGNMDYGVKYTNEWRLDFDFEEQPEFTIEADKTCNLELGKPELLIRAVEEKSRYKSDVKEQTVYPRGTNVYITRIVKGTASELYGRFAQQGENSQSYKAIEPEIKIVDSEGKEVAAAKIKYG
jgi:hypothetical protein